jgi:hypothetical protein
MNEQTFSLQPFPSSESFPNLKIGTKTKKKTKSQPQSPAQLALPLE